MNFDRFKTYLEGGRVEGSNKVEIGARNSKLPIKKELFKLNREIKFLKHSSRWDGSVLFLGDKSDNSNYAVRYLIEDDQFIDILKQENNRSLDEIIDLTCEELESGISKVVFNDSWYSDLLYLGEFDNIKAYTFTCNRDFFTGEDSKTSERYLKVILDGILRFDSIDKKDVLNTLLETRGVKGFFTYDDLLKLTK